MNVLNKFEIKLNQNMEIIGNQTKQITECEDRLKQEVEERQRVNELYELEVEKCLQLMNDLSKLETDSKIEFEKESIEFKEQKNWYLSQTERMSEQINQLKDDLNVSQTKCSHLEQTLLRRDNEIQKQNNLQKSVSNQFIEIQNIYHSLNEELNRLSENQNQLKDIGDSSHRLNIELKAELIERKEQLIAVNKDNSVLKALVSELQEKNIKREEELNDNELKALRLTQQNDLQKQEIKELRDLLEELIREKQIPVKNINKSDFNSNELSECGLNYDDSTQTIVLIEEKEN